ncbi:hypothetical protein C7T94_13765 [Pedobacter yulinensis]|uniref:HTH araC/xylS-type domain-containing protein n=1 Tax=Pedobacter yulinensis TaxID=2126353 RepID=A0A2T3HMG9_9SPHI|nr:AraC family transcriptional regulator [Pedobacter yulinensis]PST83603.1 hypothetical protein C7T94_13765 [Pedobacter yulinensis]
MPLSLFKYLQTDRQTAIARLAPRAALGQLVGEILIVPASLIPAHSAFFSDGCPTLVLTANAQSRLVLQRANKTVVLQGGWIGSSYFENLSLQLEQPGDFLIVFRFQPASFFAATGLQPAYLRQHAVLPTDVIGLFHPGQALPALQHVKRTEDFLEALPVKEAALPPSINQVIQALDATPGKPLRLADLQRRHATGYKKLERDFARITGMAPKEYLSLQRFLRTYQCLAQGQAAGMTAAAAMNGYCDQSHMIREFKKFTGTAPKALLARR